MKINQDGYSLILKNSPIDTKKYRIEFFKDGVYKYKIDFGSRDYTSFEVHRDKKRKQAFLRRFSKQIEKNKDIKDVRELTPMFLSTYILWNKPSIKGSLRDLREKYGLKIEDQTKELD